jgi:hypothetical protein
VLVPVMTEDSAIQEVEREIRRLQKALESSQWLLNLTLGR